MNYKALLKKVARENHTTPEEVDREMRAAIQAAGYNISTECFISLVAENINKQRCSPIFSVCKKREK